MRKIFLSLFVFCLLFMSSNVFAASSPSIVINDKVMNFDNPPVIESGRTLVPMKQLFEALGAKVTWNGTERSVTAVKDQTKVKLYINNKTAYVNGKAFTLDVPAKIIDSRTYIPASFTSTALGYQVRWVQAYQTVVIGTGSDSLLARLPVKVTTSSTPTVSEFEKEVVTLVNEIRTKNGLGTLKLDTHLSDVARLKSADLRDKNYFEHTSPTYGSPFEMMATYNIKYWYAGENIAAGQKTPDEVVQDWMNSPGHRANILKKEYTHIGVGHVSGGSYKHYWTQMFTKPR